MMGIPRETKRITYSSEIRAMKHVVLDDRQCAIIAGSLFGDANLCANWSKTSYRMQVRHSERQAEYVWWKYNQLKSIVTTPPKSYEKTRCVHFRTISHPTLTEMYQIFYPQGKKQLAECAVAYLAEPLVIAVWFMDDGNAVIRDGKPIGYHLNSQSFTRKENEMLVCTLKQVYNIDCSLENNHGYTRLGIWKRASRELLQQILEPHIIPSMRYKLG